MKKTPFQKAFWSLVEVMKEWGNALKVEGKDEFYDLAYPFGITKMIVNDLDHFSKLVDFPVDFIKASSSLIAEAAETAGDCGVIESKTGEKYVREAIQNLIIELDKASESLVNDVVQIYKEDNFPDLLAGFNEVEDVDCKGAFESIDYFVTNSKNKKVSAIGVSMYHSKAMIAAVELKAAEAIKEEVKRAQDFADSIRNLARSY